VNQNKIQKFRFYVKKSEFSLQFKRCIELFGNTIYNEWKYSSIGDLVQVTFNNKENATIFKLMVDTIYEDNYEL